VKKVKVKNLAEKYGVSPKAVMEELLAEGIEVSGASSPVPADMLELVYEHMNDVFGRSAKKGKSGHKGDDAADAGSGDEKTISLKPPIIVKTLAEGLNKKANEVITELMSLGILASINQTVSEEVATRLCKKFGFSLEVSHREKGGHGKTEIEEEEENPENLKPRPPVVTFLGHVDHGKTSLQDYMRKSDVVDGEAGKITQHIGASTLDFHGKQITMIDTPGHEAFTQMRARGANVTDIAILVVAADDGFMPQTIEAMNHARAANVPIIVAINKIDLPDANPDKVLLHMQQNELMSEDWGGDVGTARVSAITGEGIDHLCERILLEAEMLDLKADPTGKVKALVLEAQLEQGLGPTANIIIQKGTLKIGDIVVCGGQFGRVKTMISASGDRVKSAAPATPVKLVGLKGVPRAGDKLTLCKTEREARNIADEFTEANREIPQSNNVEVGGDEEADIDALFSKLNSADRNDLKIIIKADVRGSAEAIIDSLKKLPSEKITVDVVMNGVGGITENDVMLATASKAIIVGFHVRVNAGVNEMAKRQGVDIRLYSIIYELLADIKDALAGRLAPDKREVELGKAKILQIFSMTKGPKVCGCIVEKGLVRVGLKARVFRNKNLIFNGDVRSLRRFQDDVKEVRAGLECGIRLDNFMDFEEDDLIDIYDIELHKATLD
jgi:translation initiation factor IF-2